MVSAAAGVGARWPFVGREVELDRAQAALSERAGVVLVGPAGVGKTRIARELLRRREAAGDIVRRVLATSATSTVPLGALGPLLPPGGVGSDTEPNLVGWAARALVRDLRGRQLVLGVDDAHSLDPTSVAVVGQLALTGSARIIVTARTEVPVPDPVYVLWKERVVERLDVDNLPRDAVVEVLAAALGGQIDGAALHRIWSLTRGNALFLRELVTSARAQGSLRMVDGVWVWTGRTGPPPQLGQVLDTRLEALDRAGRSAVELLAFGEPLGLELLDRVVDTSVLEELERAGLAVSEQSGPRVDLRLAHPLYAELLRARASPLTVRSVHRRLVEAQEATGASEMRERMRLITWRLAGALPVDHEELCAAAGQLLSSDPTAAERLARAAEQAGGGFPAGLLLARVRIATGHADEGEALLADLVPRTDAERVRLATTRAQNLFYALGAPTRAVEVIRAVEGIAVASREGVVARAAGAAYERRYDEAWALLEPVLDRDGLTGGHGDGGKGDGDGIGDGIGDGAGDVVALHAAVIAVLALRGTGRFDTLLAVCERARRLATDLDAAAAEWQVLNLDMGIVHAHANAGRFEVAVERARVLYDRAVDVESAAGKIVFAGFEGLLLFFRGQVRASASRLRDATAGVHIGAAPLVPVLRLGLVQSLAVAGETAEAQALLADLGDPGEEYRPWELQARAWVAASAGHDVEAAQLMSDAADAAWSRGEVPLAMILLHSLVRFGKADGVIERLAAVVDGAEGPYPPATLAHARALAAGDPEALDALSCSFLGMGLTVVAAEAAAQASGYHRAAGRPGPAAASAARARTLARTCDGARTPAFALLDVGGLTAREREIARLAARGLSSRAIADSLVVSVRTVDNALRGVYAKLQISGRHELSESDLG